MKNIKPGMTGSLELCAQDCKVFEYKDTIYLYEPISCLIFALDKITELIWKNTILKPSITINKLKQNLCNIDKASFDESIDELLKCGLLHKKGFPKFKNLTNTQIRKFMKPELAPSSICLNITHKCNLRCIYCYGDGGSFGSKDAMMTEKVAFSTIDWLFENADKNKSKKFQVIFFGGEPLLNFSLIEKVVNYAKKLAKEKNVNVYFSMTTNGTLITPDMAKKLAEMKVSVMISIDGKEDCQNTNRPFVNGKGSHDAVMKGKSSLSKYYSHISARATLLDYNLVDTWNNLDKSGFSNIHISPAEGDLGSHFLTEHGMDNLLSQYEQLFNSIDKTINDKYEVEKKIPLNSIVIQSLRSIWKKEIRLWPCGASTNYVAVNPSGDIYSCHRFVGDKEFLLGNVLTRNMNNKIFNKIQKGLVTRNPICKSCWIRSTCAGGCIHINKSTTGKAFFQNQNQCKFYKKIAELSIIFFIKYYKDNPEMLKNILGLETAPEYR